MNGGEHYAEAERLLAMYEANSTPQAQDWAREWGDQVLAAAQVHATLAHAALYYGGADWPARPEVAF